MTVPGETPAASDHDADEEFAQVFQRYFRWLTRFFSFRVNEEHRHLAEDLAQETLIELWQDFVHPGRLGEVERLHGLLATIARRKISSFYVVKGNSLDRMTDFGDPVNEAASFVSHAYAADTPHLAALGHEFDAAMDAMSAASKVWRETDKARGALSRYLNDDARYFQGGLTPQTKARMQAELGEAETAEAHALNAFRAACEKVAGLRAELDSAAGGNWRSSSGLPASAGTRPRQDGAYTSDPTVTHCAKGHLMDRNNTHFYEDGTRSCRYCSAQKTARARRSAPRPTRAATVTTSAGVIDAARQLLTDPDNRMSLHVLAKSLGITEATLYARLPDEVAARKSCRDIDPDVLEAARSLLLDPSVTLTLAQIAEKAGCSVASIRRHLRVEQAVRQARIDAPLEAARALLSDPAYAKVAVHQIAEQTGTSMTSLYSRLPVSELRRVAKAKAKELAAAR